MVTRYSAELGQTEDVIIDYLEELRCHALEKLAAKKKFEADGLALLKIKLAGKVPDVSNHIHFIPLYISLLIV